VLVNISGTWCTTVKITHAIPVSLTTNKCYQPAVNFISAQSRREGRVLPLSDHMLVSVRPHESQTNAATSPNLTQKCSKISPGNPFILGLKGQRSRVAKTLPAWVFALLASSSWQGWLGNGQDIGPENPAPNNPESSLWGYGAHPGVISEKMAG